MDKKKTPSKATERTVELTNDIMAMTKYVMQMNAMGWYIRLVDGKARWLPSHLAEIDEELDPSQKDLANYVPSGSMPPVKNESPSLMTAIDPLHPIVNVSEFKWFQKSKYDFTCDLCHNRLPEGAELWWRRKERVPKDSKKRSITYCKKCYQMLSETQARASER